jgi:Cu/Ag efflux pump CusA
MFMGGFVMGAIVAWSLRFRLLVLGIAAAAVVFGATQLPKVSVDTLPEFAPPYVEVQTEALGLSAEEVEQLITVPLEADLLQGVAWREEIHSRSVPGLSAIVLLFEPGTDPIRARQMVAERLTQAHALPNVSRPPVMLQPLSSTSRVMMIGMSSADVSLIDMSVLARWTIMPRLLGVPGVANVAIWGQRERQLQVLIDPEAMRREQVTIRQVIETTGNSLWVSPLTFLDASTPGTGGFIDTPNQRLGIQHILPITTPEDLAQVPIEGADGIRLGDVSQVVENHQPLIGDGVVKDEPGLLLVVEKFPEANAAEVTRGIDSALAALQPGLTGIQVDPAVFRPAGFIESAARNLGLAFGIGLLLGMLLLGLLLGWRAALVGLVTIPLALTAAGVVLYLLGATANAMTLAGLMLALAVIIDDVVVGTESIRRRISRMRERGNGRSTASIIVAALLESRQAVVYATLISLLALIPAAFVSGAVGAFLPPVALAYALAVLASLLVSVTAAPALAVLLAPRHPREQRKSRLGDSLQAAYGRLLAGVVRRARLAFVAVLLLTVGAGLVFAATPAPQLARSMLPPFQPRDLSIRWEAAPGTSRDEMDRIMSRAGAELRAVPGIRNVGAHVGRAITSDRVANTNAAEMWISIDPAANYDGTLATVERIVSGYPGLAHSVSTYSTARISDVLSDAEQDVVVRIYGQDQTILRDKADEVRGALAQVDGVVAPAVRAQPDEPTLQVQVDLTAAERHGMKAGDIRREAAALLSGIQVGSLFEDQKVFEVVVWGRPELRNSLTTIGDLLLDTPDGTPVRLADVAEVKIAPTPTVIEREGVFRIADVGASVSGRDLGAVMRDIDSRLATIGFPLEYHAEVRSLAAEHQTALLQLLAIGLAAAIGIFLLLQTFLSSWRLAALAFVSLPSALIGGLLVGLLAGGGVLSLGAFVGLFVVLAIAVRHLTMSMAHYRELEVAGGEGGGLPVVLEAARDRFLPILTTTLVTAAVLTPIIVLGDLAGLEIVRPMAQVVVGGLITSTLFSLFIVPGFHSRAQRSAETTELRQATEQSALKPA